jgi:dTDP-glucose pyrophosphorylase
MVVAATSDIPDSSNKYSKIIYIDQDFHKKDKVEEEIKKYYPNANFITIDYLTEGQASTCLLAKDYINNDEELLIAACDNGMELDIERFQKSKKYCDAMIFTFRNNSSVEEKPESYGWVKINNEGEVIDTSVKIAISSNPIKDHAIVGVFWFSKGSNFVRASEKMIFENDRINNEFYVDQTMKHMIDIGLKVKIFEIDKYICWGTPKDYENYENTIKYWQDFYKNEDWIN